MKLRLQKLYETACWFGYAEVPRRKKLPGKRVNKKYTKYQLQQIAKRLRIVLKYRSVS